MKLLAIETATEACSAALYLAGEIRFRYAVQPRAHSELILKMMDELLAESGVRLNDLDALAFGRGPGSFTGVRIATGVIQGVAFGSGLPVVPVSTLAALAQAYYRQSGAKRILPAYDARVKEVYWAAYEVDDSGLVKLVGVEEVCVPEAVALPPGRGWHGVGSGWRTYEERLVRRVGSTLAMIEADLLCHARDLAVLAVSGFRAGKAVCAERALPVYLRDRVAWKRNS